MHAPHDPSAVRDLVAVAADVLARLRDRAPRVHCITNAVAQTFTANMLLAAGAVPSMTIAADEVAAFTAGADALLVNLGTLDTERREAAAIAIGVATQNGKPWVLDPVFVNRSAQRAAYARDLIAAGPRVIRLNAAEFRAVAGAEPEPAALSAFAAASHTVIGLTGAEDVVTDGARVATVANGSPLMARVTAMGCAGSALLVACLAVERDAWSATAAALLILGVSGEIAARRAEGPGSFAAAILDAVYGLERHDLVGHAKIVSSVS